MIFIGKRVNIPLLFYQDLETALLINGLQVFRQFEITLAVG